MFCMKVEMKTLSSVAQKCSITSSLTMPWIARHAFRLLVWNAFCSQLFDTRWKAACNEDTGVMNYYGARKCQMCAEAVWCLHKQLRIIYEDQHVVKGSWVEKQQRSCVGVVPFWPEGLFGMMLPAIAAGWATSWATAFDGSATRLKCSFRSLHNER